MKMFWATREMVHQLEFLMNDADAQVLRVARAGNVDRLAVDREFRRSPAGITPVEDFHQRRLAGAVLAHQRVDFAGV